MPSICRRLVRPEPAARLAWLRIAVVATILVLPDVRDAPALAAVAPVRRLAPEGLGWFVRLVPIGPTVAIVAQAACVSSALCALVGLATRPALAVLAASGFYVCALSQLSGAVWHDMHLLWMVALLAASPCDEALTFDGRGLPTPPDSERYGLPLLFARLLLACVYFFPGVHKLVSSGLDWALSDNLRNQLWWKWAQYGAIPHLRLDRSPVLLHGGGLSVMGFELLFPVLALTRRGRPWAAGLGLAFHGLAQLVFRIPFASLWMLYVIFVDPECAWGVLRRLVRRNGSARANARDVPSGPARGGPWRATAVVGAALFAGAFVQGARGQMFAFPFACYPTFEWQAGTEMPDLLVEAENADGTRTLVAHGRDARGRRSQRQWGEIWSLAGASAPVDPARLRAYVESERARGPARSALVGARRVRVYRGYLSVVPEDRGLPARRGRMLAEFTLDEAGTDPSPSGGEGDSAPE